MVEAALQRSVVQFTALLVEYPGSLQRSGVPAQAPGVLRNMTHAHPLDCPVRSMFQLAESTTPAAQLGKLQGSGCEPRAAHA